MGHFGAHFETGVATKTRQNCWRKLNNTPINMTSVRQMKPRLWKTIVLLVLISRWPALCANLCDQELVFHITDFGISQFWRDDLRVGGPFSEKHGRVFPELNHRQGAQLLIPMPTDKELGATSVKEMADRFASKLADQVNHARANGITTYEIQIVQHVGVKGYFDSDRQHRVKKFGAIAYEAIGKLVWNQKNSGRSVEVDLTLGSNGTVAFTENIGSWKAYRESIRKVTLNDGRAFLEPTKASILALGANKVRIVNTKGDLPAAPKLSIGNFDTTRQLMKEKGMENLTVILLEPVKLNTQAHVSFMAHPENEFVVRRLQGERRIYMGHCNAQQIRQSPSFWNDSLPPAKTQPAVEYTRLPPDSAHPNTPPRPDANGTKKYLQPRQNMIIDDLRRKEPNALPRASTKPGGVLLRTDVVTNAPVSLDGVFAK